MVYTRKTWVNKEDIPESELGQHPRFDADNMNRIEAGIEEAHNSVGEHTHTKEQVGLGNVPNVATNDQTPTYSDTSTLATLSSGEKLNVALQKIKCAITNLINHLADTTKHITANERTTWNNKANSSHTHTKSQITDFPTSMPASDVYSWAKQSNKPSYTASEVGAAPTQHNHSADSITSGTLNSNRLPIVPIVKGGTGATTTEEALANLGASSIITGTYTGTTHFTESGQQSINLGFKPKAVIVSNNGGLANGGFEIAQGQLNEYSKRIEIIDNGFIVYSDVSTQTLARQLNRSDFVYSYMALN